MESNITRDHIALEAMKVLLNKAVERKRTFGRGAALTTLQPGVIAEVAYDFADAMIAAREKGDAHD